MIEPVLIVIILAVFSSMKDRLKSRFEYTIWKKLNARQWFDPAVSWQNKHRWKPRWLFKTVFVWTTDFWHFLKFVIWNVVFISLIYYDLGRFDWQTFFAMWIVWGLFFEVVWLLNWSDEV